MIPFRKDFAKSNTDSVMKQIQIRKGMYPEHVIAIQNRPISQNRKGEG